MENKIINLTSETEGKNGFRFTIDKEDNTKETLNVYYGKGIYIDKDSANTTVVTNDNGYMEVTNGLFEGICLSSTGDKSDGFKIQEDGEKYTTTNSWDFTHETHKLILSNGYSVIINIDYESDKFYATTYCKMIIKDAEDNIVKVEYNEILNRK